MFTKRIFCWLCFAMLWASCVERPIQDLSNDLTQWPYDPQPYNLVIPPGFPSMYIPPDNPLTVAGVELGRRLFYDPILSGDSTMSCSSCHMPASGFTDNKAVSTGIAGIAGARSAMSLENVGFFNNGLFWDGRVTTLEEQALLPVEDPIELHNKWPLVEMKLRRHPTYPKLFREAFGIESKDQITKELAAKAIAQFERTLVSSGKSKFDLAQTPGSGVFFTDLEQEGYDLYFQLNGASDGQCGHCHTGPLITTNEYLNNGLTEAATFNDFPDKGRGAIEGKPTLNGMFRTPSLRNIALTAPYMHDGRFKTLEEVLDHYGSGGHYSPNVSVFLIQLKQKPLTAHEKKAILALLHTMTDTIFINNPAYQNPFE